MVGWKLRLVCAGMAVALSTAAGQSGDNVRATPFVGGAFEASGVATLPGGTAVLMVADSRSGDVIWMDLTPDGTQKSPVRSVRTGVELEDPEGITTDGSWFYVVGSQSKSGVGPGLVRFRFDSNDRRLSSVEAVDGLAAFLSGAVPELRDASELNIEGLAWDPQRSRLLLGLRSPLLNREAIVVPLKLKDDRGPLSRGNLVVDGVLRLPLGGHGIRSFEYDSRSARFLVIAGASGDDRGDFRLLEWSGAPGDGLRPIASVSGDLKPEGVARVGDRILIVCDTSRFIVLR